jgi:hypothetical protein
MAVTLGRVQGADNYEPVLAIKVPAGLDVIADVVERYLFTLDYGEVRARQMRVVWIRMRREDIYG